MKTFKTLTESHIDIDKMSDVQMLRKALVDELKTINLYEQMASAAQDSRVVTLLMDLAHEEKVHSVELEELIERIDPGYEQAEEEGEKEIEDLFGKEDDD